MMEDEDDGIISGNSGYDGNKSDVNRSDGGTKNVNQNENNVKNYDIDDDDSSYGSYSRTELPS